MASDPAERAGAVLEIDLTGIAANWRLLAARVEPARCAAVVKADAYGLGAARVIPALLDAGCRTFFVATLEEAHSARALAPGPAIFILGGLLPRTEKHVANLCAIPVLSSLDEIRAWVSLGAGARRAPPAALHLDTDSTGLPAAYGAATVQPAVGITRTEDIGSGHTQTEQVFDSSAPATAGAGTYAFGRFDSPQWLDAATRTIPTPPTTEPGPRATRSETIGFTAITPGPACTKPASGWPVAIFGPGITRSKYDVFLASDENLRQCIATIAIDPVGHAYGPASFVTISRTVPPGSTVTVTSHGRGVDVNGDGVIADQEGVQTRGQPDPNAAVALRDGLRQTALDNMALVRALAHDYGGGNGFAIPGGGALSRTDVKYYAESLGGIYGTMVMAIDPKLSVGALNVPGGPILEIARLSPGFRGQVGVELHNRVPSLYACSPNPPSYSNCTGFQEQAPLYLDPPVTNPTPSAIAIQQVGARANWIDRLGSPETFAPLLLPNGKRVIYQFAFGDQTVPNPTSATLVRAGGLQSVTSLYRHDKDPAAPPNCNPHGFLLDPRISGSARSQAQLQIATFFQSNGATVLNPGPSTWEVPVTNPDTLETVNFPNPPPPPAPAC